LSLGALGVVFGDYRHQPAVRAADGLSIDNGPSPIPDDVYVYGVLSLVFWVDPDHRLGQVRRLRDARRQRRRGASWRWPR